MAEQQAGEAVDIADKDLRRAIRASLVDDDEVLGQAIADSLYQYSFDKDLRRAIEASMNCFTGISITETGESSNSKPDPSFTCQICIELKTFPNLFGIEGCIHAYCTECIIKYVESKLEDNVTSFGCPVPKCNGLLKPEYCKKILPPDVFDNWCKALCENLIQGSAKFYCPYKDCSALLINEAREEIRESECPYCRRLFCAKCKVSWHAEMECAEFQKLNENERGKEDLLVMQLAKNKNWRRCPKCSFFVEKSDGCHYIKCRCGYAFCYHCGAQSTTTSHGYHCPKCRQ